MSCRKQHQKLWDNYLKKYGDYRFRLHKFLDESSCVEFEKKRLYPKKISSLPSKDQSGWKMIFDDKKFSDHLQTVKDHRSTSHSNRPKSIEPSLPTVKTNHPSIHESFPNNPYRALLERLRQADPSKSVAHQMKTMEPHSSDLSSIDRVSRMKIQTFLTFLRSLDPDNVENSIDEKTILSLFSVDEQMTSSIYVTDDVRELKVVPKSLLHSLKQSNEDEEVINKIQTELSTKNKTSKKIFNSELKVPTTPIDLSFTEQDQELNTRLYQSDTLKAFKSFLLERNSHRRIPKVINFVADLRQT